MCPLFRSAGKNLSPFRTNLNEFCFITGAFNFPLHAVAFLSTTAQPEINIRDHAPRETNATYRTGPDGVRVFC